MLYKIIDKSGQDFYIECKATDIKSELFEKIWEAMEFQSVEPWKEVDISSDIGVLPTYNLTEE